MNTYTKTEVKEALKTHRLWVESKGKIGRQKTFWGERLRKISFVGMNLEIVDLSDADLTGCNFTGVNLSRANLKGAELKDVTGLVIPEVGKAYELLPFRYRHCYFFVESEGYYCSFQKGEVGLILGIHGSQNENRLDTGRGKGSFDLLFLKGKNKGQVWRGIDWSVLLTNIGKEVEPQNK